MDITNKTSRPIRVPIADGKKLFLGPGKTGQIHARSLDHPPLAALIEAGDLEVDDTKRREKNSPSTGSTAPGGGQTGPSTNIRHTGDR